MLHPQPTYEEMLAALKASRLPPKEHFQRMVRRGLIDSEGRLTRLYGGQAELEPEAVEYLKSQEQDSAGPSANGHRS